MAGNQHLRTVIKGGHTALLDKTCPRLGPAGAVLAVGHSFELYTFSAHISAPIFYFAPFFPDRLLD